MALPLHLPARTVLFDLDGTLCDSEAGIIDHLAAAMATVGLAVPDREVLRTCVGPPWTEGFPPAVGVPLDLTWDVIRAYRATYDDAAPSLAVPFPGMPEAVAALAGAGVAMAVATSKPQHLADRILAEGPMAGHFPVVVGADPAAGRHTKADSVAGALAGLGWDRSGSSASAVAGRSTDTTGIAMVGDRLHDVHGAAVHGIPTVGVRWGSAPHGELEEAGAAAVVSTPDELADLLLGLRTLGV